MQYIWIKMKELHEKKKNTIKIFTIYFIYMTVLLKVALFCRNMQNCQPMCNRIFIFMGNWGIKNTHSCYGFCRNLPIFQSPPHIYIYITIVLYSLLIYCTIMLLAIFYFFISFYVLNLHVCWTVAGHKVSNQIKVYLYSPISQNTFVSVGFTD